MMSGDHDVCSNCGAECFWCSCGDEKQPEREAYNQGAKDFAEEVHVRARRIVGKQNGEYREFGAAFLELEYERVRGEWPKETP